jgi:hypothetical protein
LAEVEIAAGRIFRGQADVTDDLLGLADVAYGTEAVMKELGLAPGEVHVVIVLAGRAPAPTEVGLTLIGDGQQFIYPGGFTLAEAGISIAAVAGWSCRPTIAIPAKSSS